MFKNALIVLSFLGIVLICRVIALEHTNHIISIALNTYLTYIKYKLYVNIYGNDRTKPLSWYISCVIIQVVSFLKISETGGKIFYVCCNLLDCHKEKKFFMKNVKRIKKKIY